MHWETQKPDRAEKKPDAMDLNRSLSGCPLKHRQTLWPLQLRCSQLFCVKEEENISIDHKYDNSRKDAAKCLNSALLTGVQGHRKGKKVC